MLPEAYGPNVLSTIGLFEPSDSFCVASKQIRESSFSVGNNLARYFRINSDVSFQVDRLGFSLGAWR
jgi:hypothetical protein